MLVTTVSNFVAAVNGVAPSSKGNNYAAFSGTALQPKRIPVSVTQNGNAYLSVTYVLPAGPERGVSTDANSTGALVVYKASDGVEHIVDAAQFVAALQAN